MSKETKGVAMKKAICMIHHSCIYPEGFFPLIHILWTKSCTDTGPEVVYLYIVHLSKGKNTKQKTLNQISRNLKWDKNYFILLQIS